MACTPTPLFDDGFEGASGGSPSPPPCLVDDSATSVGVRALVVADIDDDGDRDLLTAHAYHVDRLGHYPALGAGRFDAQRTIDTGTDDPIGVATGDFDADGRLDVASLTGTEGTLRWYRHTGAGFADAQVVHAGRLLGNGLVGGDFDGSGGDDLVVIGQHSIDFFRSAGGTALTREVILSPETAPDVLECLALDRLDADADGDLDVVVAETRGGVLYLNDGAGHFAPRLFTTQRRIMTAIHAFDADGDSWPDVVTQTSAGDLVLHFDVGVGAPSEGRTLHATAPVALGSIVSVDLDGDGRRDLQYAAGQVLRNVRNLGGSEFAEPIELLRVPGWFIDEVAAGDVDGRDDLVWSAANGRIGYFSAAAGR